MIDYRDRFRYHAIIAIDRDRYRNFFAKFPSLVSSHLDPVCGEGGPLPLLGHVVDGVQPAVVLHLLKEGTLPVGEKEQVVDVVGTRYVL